MTLVPRARRVVGATVNDEIVQSRLCRSDECRCVAACRVLRSVLPARSSRKLSELVGDEDRALLWATMSAEYAKVAKDESVGYDESSEVVEEDKSSDGCCKAVRVGSANCGHCGSPCARC